VVDVLLRDAGRGGGRADYPRYTGVPVVEGTLSREVGKFIFRRYSVAKDPRFIKFPAEARRFGGKVYKYLIWGNNTETTRDVERWRKRGYDVRRVRWHGGYAVYIRKR